eukprot:m.89785 g.89785  ORF g.89785 m.89785 type:complete len:146 (-) comp11779_c0_seq2:16-453(-)
MHGKYEKGITLGAVILSRSTRALGNRHPLTLVFQANVGAIKRDMQEFAEAEETVTSVLDAMQEVLGDHHPSKLKVAELLGSIILARGRAEEAVKILLTTSNLMKDSVGEDDFAIGTRELLSLSLSWNLPTGFTSVVIAEPVVGVL